jgi:hypothetical protein
MLDDAQLRQGVPFGGGLLNKPLLTFAKLVSNSHNGSKVTRCDGPVRGLQPRAASRSSAPRRVTVPAVCQANLDCDAIVP